WSVVISSRLATIFSKTASKPSREPGKPFAAGSLFHPDDTLNAALVQFDGDNLVCGIAYKVQFGIDHLVEEPVRSEGKQLVSHLAGQLCKQLIATCQNFNGHDWTQAVFPNQGLQVLRADLNDFSAWLALQVTCLGRDGFRASLQHGQFRSRT